MNKENEEIFHKVHIVCEKLIYRKFLRTIENTYFFD